MRQEYLIIESKENATALEKKVKDYLEAGYELLGAPTISVSETDDHYYFNGFQAMVRKVTY